MMQVLGAVGRADERRTTGFAGEKETGEEKAWIHNPFLEPSAACYIYITE
jgi:hypothetical protein